MKAVPQKSSNSDKEWRKSFDYIKPYTKAYYYWIIIMIILNEGSPTKQQCADRHCLIDVSSLSPAHNQSSVSLSFYEVERWHQRSMSQNRHQIHPSAQVHAGQQVIWGLRISKVNLISFMQTFWKKIWWHLHIISHPCPSRWPHHWHQRLHGNLLVHGDERPLPSICQVHGNANSSCRTLS